MANTNPNKPTIPVTTFIGDTVVYNSGYDNLAALVVHVNTGGSCSLLTIDKKGNRRLVEDIKYSVTGSNCWCHKG